MSKNKGEWRYILSNKIKYYTKESLRLTNIIAIGIFIITAIILTKYKPVFAVSMNGESIGYVKDKKEFQELINTKLYNNEEENIAYSEQETAPEYEMKFVEKQKEINEEEVLVAIKEQSKIMYYQYAITTNGENKGYVSTMEEAQEVVNTLNTEFGEDVNIGIVKVYTENIEEVSSVEVASVSSALRTTIQEEKEEQQAKEEEEKRKQSHSINGVYIAVTPVRGTISSRYGSNSSVRNHTHMGLDIAAKTGTPIKAAAEGKVTFSGTKGAYGYLMIITHDNGVETYYGHCSKLYKKVGESVSAGETIAAVGSTGYSTGPHLHFEIKVNGKNVNPQKYL